MNSNNDYGNYPVTFGTSTITLPTQSDNAWNGNGDSFIGYCFAEKVGSSKIGKYKGNGSTDGVFIYTGFRPSFILIKSKTEDFYYQSFNSNRQPLKKVSSFPISNLPKYFFNKNLIFCGNLNIKLIKELRKKKLYLHKNKFYNSELIINLFIKKKIKVTKSLDPIYVYEHYAKKN